MEKRAGCAKGGGLFSMPFACQGLSREINQMCGCYFVDEVTKSCRVDMKGRICTLSSFASSHDLPVPEPFFVRNNDSPDWNANTW